MSLYENQKLIKNKNQHDHDQHIVEINKIDNNDIDDSDMACKIGCLMGCLFNLPGLLCIFCFNKKGSYLAGLCGAFLWILLIAIVFYGISYMAAII